MKKFWIVMRGLFVTFIASSFLWILIMLFFPKISDPATEQEHFKSMIVGIVILMISGIVAIWDALPVRKHRQTSVDRDSSLLETDNIESQ